MRFQSSFHGFTPGRMAVSQSICCETQREVKQSRPEQYREEGAHRTKMWPKEGHNHPRQRVSGAFSASPPPPNPTQTNSFARFAQVKGANTSQIRELAVEIRAKIGKNFMN